MIPPRFPQDRRSAEVDEAMLGQEAAAPLEHEQKRFIGVM